MYPFWRKLGSKTTLQKTICTMPLDLRVLACLVETMEQNSQRITDLDLTDNPIWDRSESSSQVFGPTRYQTSHAFLFSMRYRR
jgi:hypothetical protein